jgi:hypothetical protein
MYWKSSENGDENQNFSIIYDEKITNNEIGYYCYKNLENHVFIRKR